VDGLNLLNRSWGDLAGIVVALWFVFSSSFADLPAKRVLDAVALLVLLISAARIVQRWRQG
jgi:hypothetical protein